MIRFKSARHGLAYRILVENNSMDFGVVQRNANGSWSHQWHEDQPKVLGFRTRMDAVVGLLLSWGGRDGAPSAPEIYKWVLDK